MTTKVVFANEIDSKIYSSAQMTIAGGVVRRITTQHMSVGKDASMGKIWIPRKCEWPPLRGYDGCHRISL